MFQGPFAALTLRGILLRQWINRNVSRKINKASPRGRDAPVSEGLHDASSHFLLSEAFGLLQYKKITSRKAYTMQKKFIEESRPYKRFNVSIIMPCWIPLFWGLWQALNDMCLCWMISHTQRGNRKSLNFTFIKDPKNQSVCWSAWEIHYKYLQENVTYNV